MTFDGLRSRWTTPRLWAYRRPAQTWTRSVRARWTGQRALAEQLAERQPVEVLHREEEPTVLRLAVVVDHHDVRMGELREGVCLQAEAIDQPIEVLVLRRERQDLEGDLATEGHLVREVDGGHPAARDLAHDRIPGAERRPDAPAQTEIDAHRALPRVTGAE